MEILSKKSGYSSVSDLHSNEIAVLIKEFLGDKSYRSWNKNSKDRFKFDVIIRNCKCGIVPFLSDILEIMKDVVDPQNDIEIRYFSLLKLKLFLLII